MAQEGPADAHDAGLVWGDAAQQGPADAGLVWRMLRKQGQLMLTMLFGRCCARRVMMLAWLGDAALQGPTDAHDVGLLRRM